MATEEEEVITIEHLTRTLGHIREWLELVQIALENANPHQEVTIKKPGNILPVDRGRREFGKVCENVAVISKEWSDQS